MTALAPPFPYYGGKQTIARDIVEQLPPHGHYVEPYAGSLAVLLAKPPSAHETVNDLDGDIVALWRVLRDRPDDLERVCALTPHARAEHQQALHRPEDLDDLERARRIWVRLTQGRGGSLHPTGWRHFQNPRGRRGGFASMGAYLEAYAARILPAADRLARVSLECRPALDIIAAYGRHDDVLLYVDPPYLAETRNSRTGNHYRHELRSPAEHEDLADALLACRAAVVLSGYPSALYDDLYSAWRRVEIPTYTGNGAPGAERRTEVLWINRPGRDLPLFDLEASA